ncbi:hypothetical protein KOW79_021427 [Hemibagrus wyckioides]|uniref:Interleukin-1 beta n=1 Tax=Hemibagrus wyckioides TaxID=337641 RepID=A0A9D3N3J8_9TELE|nr:uncharacterized protein LOC131347913 [Hemibagrus wyckioides]KAG7315339.1 hypothetical protein KOW79_021427 [Hemibagrus wyckioides]
MLLHYCGDCHYCHCALLPRTKRNMEQTGITEYALMRDTKTENISLNILGMVKKGGSVIVSEVSDCKIICTLGECVLDGPHHELRGIGAFKKDKESQVLIQSLQNTPISPENIKPRRRGACMPKPTSDITIYYYQTNMMEDLGKGIPVVLNISNTNQFLKCTFISEKAVLSLECLEKERLDFITTDNSDTWPFVFYLSGMKDNCRCFESAQCRGWFIRTEFDSVCMAEHKDKDKEPEKYAFIIMRSSNATKSK